MDGKRLGFIIIVSVLISFLPSMVFGYTFPLATSSEDDTKPAVAYAPDRDEYLVVWEFQVPGELGSRDIYGQRVSSAGSLLGGQIQIASDARHEENPQVAYNTATHEYLVVYELTFSATDHDIYVQRVSSYGAVVGSRMSVATSGIYESNPVIAYNWQDNEYQVAYEHRVGGDEFIQNDIYGQKRDYDGSAIGSPAAISSAASDESNPALTFDGIYNQFLVVWQVKQADGGYDIYGRRVGANGYLYAKISIATWPEYDLLKPRVAFNSTAAQFLVVWEDHRWDWGNDWNIYGQRISSAGSLVGNTVFIYSNSDQHSLSPDVAANSTANEYMVVWEFEHSASDHDVYRRRVAGDGTLLDSHTVVSNQTSQESLPAVASNGVDAYLIAWEDGRTGSQGLNLYGERVEIPVFTGHVYEGQVGNYRDPLANVTLNLYCADNSTDLGSYLTSSTTDSTGSYSLMPTLDCSYYNIVQNDLLSYTSTGALSTGGVVISNHRIRYASPLTSKVLDNNNFWDITDPVPGSWSGFSPSGWVTSQTVSTSIGVQDAGSGLDASTAQYSFSVDGGTTWSNWLAATCLQCEGSTSPQVIAAYGVGFGRDSGQTGFTRIKFRISDLGGNLGQSPVYLVAIDSAPPSNPVSVSGDRSIMTWSNDSTLRMRFPGATDDGSGVFGYSYAWTAQTSTVPDEVWDSQDDLVDTTIPSDGTHWYFHVRARDNAGNWAAGAVHLGPFYLDRAPPQNPTTISSTYHTPNVWSNQNRVTCQWSGAIDNSGQPGYSYVFNQLSTTVPDPYKDTDMVVVTSSPLTDSNNWYFHVRAVDKAGNPAVGAAHYGPIYIDTTPPSSWVISIDAYHDNHFIDLQWVGDPGVGAPISGYDIKVVDQFNGNVTTSTLYSNTHITATTFTGQRGHTYYFSSRARDQVGNQESYPTIADAVTTVGKNVIVRVFKESGVPSVGAKVYHNGAYLGKTVGNGTITAPDVMANDTLAALDLVYEHSATKADHSQGSATGKDWDWRVYQTSVGIGTGTEAILTPITDINSDQNLIVRQSQSLVGFHVVVTLNWDANNTYWDTLIQGLQNAGNYLYDGGDGQFFWELIEVYDNWERFANSDIHVYAHNSVRPNAHVGGINAGPTAHIHLGRYWDGNSGNKGEWSNNNGFTSMIHEWGHYGMTLWDEYLPRDDKQTDPAFCSSNYLSVPQDQRASIMNHQYDCSEFCSRINPAHTHRTQTQHDAVTEGESTWETIVKNYTDPETTKRWVILSPDDRRRVVPGPDQIPIDSWSQISMNNVFTGACDPFSVSPVYTATGLPVKGAKVWLDPGDPARDIEQGITDNTGDITIFGAHNGDTLHIYHEKNNASYSGPLYCTPALPVLVFDLSSLVFTFIPTSVNSVMVMAKTGEQLATDPLARIWQRGTEAPADLQLEYDAVNQAYTGEVVLDPNLEAGGYVKIQFEDKESRLLTRYQEFSIKPVLADQDNLQLYSNDGIFQLIIPAGALTSDTAIAIQPSSLGHGRYGDLVLVGSAYEVLLASGQQTLNQNAMINMRFDSESAKGLDPDSLQLAFWDENREIWVPMGSITDPDHNMVSGLTGHLSVFGILGWAADSVCAADFDADRDVDGLDLHHQLTQDTNLTDEEFAAGYGRVNCP